MTESGINAGGGAQSALPEGFGGEQTTSRAIGLVWIGAPVGTHAGLLILIGNYEDPTAEGDTFGWPLPLSRDLGVRIYENNRA